MLTAFVGALSGQLDRPASQLPSPGTPGASSSVRTRPESLPSERASPSWGVGFRGQGLWAAERNPRVTAFQLQLPEEPVRSPHTRTPALPQESILVLGEWTPKLTFPGASECARLRKEGLCRGSHQVRSHCVRWAQCSDCLLQEEGNGHIDDREGALGRRGSLDGAGGSQGQGARDTRLRAEPQPGAACRTSLQTAATTGTNEFLACRPRGLRCFLTQPQQALQSLEDFVVLLKYAQKCQRRREPSPLGSNAW